MDIFMKKIILISAILIFSFFGSISSNDSHHFFSFSKAIAEDPCANHERGTCTSTRPGETGGDNCRACTATEGSGGSSGNTGTGGGRSGGSSGSRDRDNQEERQETEQEPTQNRAQCEASSEHKQAMCNGGVHQLNISTLRNCNTHEFTVSGRASVGLRVFLEVEGGASVTVRSYDACVDIAGAVKDGLLNDCEIAHTGRVTQCPAE